MLDEEAVIERSRRSATLMLAQAAEIDAQAALLNAQNRLKLARRPILASLMPFFTGSVLGVLTAFIGFGAGSVIAYVIKAFS